MNINYSKICNHKRLERINNNFVRCMNCGQSMISQEILLTNKTRNDFTNENKSFVRNFDRNFTNILEEVDEQSMAPLYEYYTDRNWVNLIVINKIVQFYSNPAKYETIINGTKSYLNENEIKKLLFDVKAIKVTENDLNIKYGANFLKKLKLK